MALFDVVKSANTNNLWAILWAGTWKVKFKLFMAYIHDLFKMSRRPYSSQSREEADHSSGKTIGPGFST
jgi:hypothetical protein